MRHLISRASRMMVMSRQGRDLLIETYGASRAMLDVIHLACPIARFAEASHPRQTDAAAKFRLQPLPVPLS
jgi:hypothetical protein